MEVAINEATKKAILKRQLVKASPDQPCAKYTDICMKKKKQKNTEPLIAQITQQPKTEEHSGQI